MKKILLPLLLAVILLIPGCKPEENPVSPPFFKITDTDTGGVVYLLGTMHVGKPNTIYPAEVYTALDECSALAVEIDLEALEADKDCLNNAMKLLECNASDYFKDDYGEIKSFFQKRQIYSSALENYMPSVWSSTLSSRLAADCGLQSEFGTDREIVSYAKAHSMKIIELETVEQQYQMNANEAPELQIYSLLTSVRMDYEDQKDQMKELYRAWSENDSTAFEKMLYEEEIPEELRVEYDKYYNELYTARQEKMAGFINKTLSEGGKAVVAVGAMHCYAAPDILDFIEEGAVIEEIEFELSEAA